MQWATRDEDQALRATVSVGGCTSYRRYVTFFYLENDRNSRR
jgi:hypothetical protein